MKKERLLIDGRITTATSTIITLARLSIDCWQEGDSYAFSGVKEPYALVLVDADRTHVVNTAGLSMELIDCFAKIPELAQVLDELSVIN